VSRRWTNSGDLADGVERLGEVAAVLSAGPDGGKLSDELFALRGVIGDSPELRDALSDPNRSQADKAGLLEALLDGKALPATVTLAKQALSGTYGTVMAGLASYRRLAADVQGESVATVRVARPLSDEQEKRLTTALARQYGRPVHANVVVDPEVVGGIRVEIGDDVIDGTIASRLDEAGRKLAG
jgi:F-type H+-transporting ATPase subunit delta